MDTRSDTRYFPVHQHNPGDVVTVEDRTRPQWRIEGQAKIVKLLDATDCYLVDFDDGRGPVERHVDGS